MKNIVRYIIGFIVGISITVTATLLYSAKDVEYKNEFSEVNNVNEALNELYDKEFGKKNIEVTVYGAANEVVTITSDNRTNITVTTNMNGEAKTIIPDVGEDKENIKLKGSISGKTFDQVINYNTTEVYARPEHSVYWYGARCVELTNFNKIPSTSKQPTITWNQNDVTIVDNDVNQMVGIQTVNPIDVTNFKSVVYVTYVGASYGGTYGPGVGGQLYRNYNGKGEFILQATSSKPNSYETSVGDLTGVTGNVYVLGWSYYTTTAKIYAIYFE